MTKKALILAGGGLKVAFQAGVLQVWLDEAGLQFDLADGASGGTFNLAMWCQGMSGRQIADNWRNLPPFKTAGFNWKEYYKLIYAESFLSFANFRNQVFPFWGLDWAKINQNGREATFNVINFSKQDLEVITPERMNAGYLAACVALPMWFPPVKINGDTYIDSVFMTDANLEEAIRRGADELWVIWTVSQKGEYNPGFIANYFAIIEACANGNFRRLKARIEANNAAIAQGNNGEFGRTITLKILEAEVPLHYVMNIGADRYKQAVSLGVHMAREWCKKHHIPLKTVHPEPADPTYLEFTETMRGWLAFDQTDYSKAVIEGKKAKQDLSFTLTIKIDGVGKFVTEPSHEAKAIGYIECGALGGKLPVAGGTFNLFVDKGDPQVKQMLYRLHFHDKAGHALTLSGFKAIKNDKGFDLWSDTTTLYYKVLQGHVSAEAEANAVLVGSGIITIGLLDFLKQLTTFRATSPHFWESLNALYRFGMMWFGKTWDVYATKILSSAPF
jgi:predicted patatin/cPLA2 family phospholipase